MSDYFDQMLFEEISPKEQEAIIQEAVEKLTNKNLSFRQLTDMRGLRDLAQSAVSEAVAARRQSVPMSMAAVMTDEVVGHVGGLGFLLPLFQRDDINEIILLSTDGSLWILPKGEENFVKHIVQVDRKEVSKALDALLRPSGKSVSEAQPSVNAKLERIDSLPGLAGGARIKVLHPVIAPGKGKYPEFNIRLFEPKPVKPEQLIEWQVAPEIVIRKLLSYVEQGARILVSGGTKSGKTTTLSALCSAVPKEARIVKIEDPEEIWIEHPHVQTVEARLSPIGTQGSVVNYTLRDAVDDAMRMSPQWLVVGEVRDGSAGSALFRAMMSDHPGLTTFHAEDPKAAAKRMALNMLVDEGIDMQAGKSLFAEAVDMVIQVGFRAQVDGSRRRCMVSISEVERDLDQFGEVVFHNLYQYDDPQNNADLKPMKRGGYVI